ncbi:MAG: Ldh family oxidoreductase [Gemmatimonadetes bacterium]|nr:Ldh family oxidoreductase [Gemmatimonadota bacterium]
MVVLTVRQLTALLEALADSFNMSEAERSAWIEHCVLVELRGNLMQSLAYIEHHWIQRFTDGRVNFGARIRPIIETPAMAVLDADGALGPYAGKTAMELACSRAQKHGAYTVAVRNSNDWMMIGYTTRQALRYDCIGIAMVNSRPEVAPWGGTKAIYGLNPFSFAIPAGRHYPILVDMSSSDTGGLRVQEQLIRGDEIADGLFYNAEGKIVTDPQAWGTYNLGWGIAGGAQRMPGYRDLALTVVMDSIGGALSGMSCALDLGTPEPAVDGVRTPRGQVVTALHVDHFTPLEAFKAKVDRAIDQAKSSPLAEGFTEILMPGERGFREEERRRREGIPFNPKVWESVRRACAGRGIDADAVANAAA